MVGLAPEGEDSPSGGLKRPPPGARRFIALLGLEKLQLLPAGLYDAGRRLHLSLGELRPIPQPVGAAQHRDRETADFVMQAIAGCLPASMRGEYAGEGTG